jgi:DNA repair exonuclease SbcCD ATPase subunit
MIIFQKLRWKNFLSTGNIFTEIDLNKNSTTLIVGENGAGKSTILDALTYSLFGKPFRKVNKPQLVNSITRKDTIVEIEFHIGLISYKIVRGMKPNIFEVYQNGSLLNQSAEMKDYQEILEKQILKLNFKSFCQVVVLGSASFVPFMQLPGGQRREIIEDLLDLQIFTTMNSLLKDKISNNSEKLADVVSEQKLVSEKIKIIKEHMLEKQLNNEKLITNKLDVIDDTDSKIESLNTSKEKLIEACKVLQQKTEDEQKINSRIDKLRHLRHKIEAKLAILDNDIKFFEKHDNCPTCKQVIAEDFKIDAVLNKQKEIDDITLGLEKLTTQYNEASAKLSEIVDIVSQINTNKMEQYKVENTISSLIKYRDQLHSEIDNINTSQAIDEDIKITDLENELNDVAKRYNEVSEQKNIYIAISFLLKDTGIKARIIKQYVPVINNLINKYLSAMDFFVQFELDEEFNETIKSRFRDEFSYASFSEGEKMRINLAILFTWRAIAKLRNSVSTNLLIMDEVMDGSLDANGTEEFLKILMNLTTDSNTFIISHKTDQLYDKFANIIKFEKYKNFSKAA